MSYDICIIGGGPGGYSAAIKGAQLGGKIALVERESLGGTCLNHGCIPTKNLYSVSELIRKCSESENYGIEIGSLKYDFNKIQTRKKEVVDHLKNGLYKLFKDHKIDIISGKGAIEGKSKVRIDRPGGTEIIDAKSIIIATGSEAADIPPLRIDGRSVLGNREILAMEEVPRKLVIIGGGPIGCEFANIFSRLGSEVTIIEVMDRLLPYCEKEISRLIKKRFEERGINIHLGSGVKSADIKETQVEVHLKDEVIIADKGWLVSDFKTQLKQIIVG